jgi:hypothetical protein
MKIWLLPTVRSRWMLDDARSGSSLAPRDARLGLAATLIALAASSYEIEGPSMASDKLNYRPANGVQPGSALAFPA